jgi:hypothetical protein
MVLKASGVEHPLFTKTKGKVMKSRLLENGMMSWECRIDRDHPEADEATAVIHIPIAGSPHMVLSVCEIDCIPCGPDEYGDNNIIRDGEDGERWRNVVLIACAPHLLNAVQQAEKKLEAIVQAGMADGGICKTEHDLWVSLEGIRRELDVAADWATDVGSF